MPNNGEQGSQRPEGSCADPVGTQRLAELAAEAGSGQDRAGGHAGHCVTAAAGWRDRGRRQRNPTARIVLGVALWPCPAGRPRVGLPPSEQGRGFGVTFGN